ncbi:GlxA family transcriptional regulator [Thalassospira povalilytica]|uniref:GlxA family transcriptional regulator n=2 Tax=Thalassospira TaxID=168934 RepID=UPI001F36B26D|nr:GlxA family transcriptional regulator [Thalassospira povalilytica]
MTSGTDREKLRDTHRDTHRDRDEDTQTQTGANPNPASPLTRTAQATRSAQSAKSSSSRPDAHPNAPAGPTAFPAPQHIGFFLLPDFALMSYASAIEPLRAANLLAGRPVYKILNYSATGGNVLSSTGTMVPTTPLAQAPTSLHSLFVCAGGHPSQWQAPGMLPGLRKLARWGVRMGGISSGAYVLAAAGLLGQRQFTIHWEHAPALIEAFPDLEPKRARFVIDGDRITCGGGVAPLDMMHAMIAQHLGSDFATRVSDWFLHTQVGTSTGSQRASLAERYNVHHPGLLRVLEKMETTIEDPKSREEMARFARLSTRQLDRLFDQHLGKSFLETYRQVRLDHANRLLTQSALTISEIAFATGFSNSSHFSRSYKATYGVTPSMARGD